MKKLLLLFFFGTMAYAQPNIWQPDDLSSCESSPGVATFDLTVNDMLVLAGQNPNYYSVTYYETQAQAEAGSDAIANPAAYTSASAFIYVRVTVIANPNSYALEGFYISVVPVPASIDLPVITHCSSPFNLMVNENLMESSDSAYYYTSQADAEAGMNAIANPQSFSDESATSVWIRIENIYGCFVVVEQEIVANEGVFNVEVVIDSHTVTFDNQTEGNYQYSLDDSPWQSNPVFNNVPYGAYIGEVKDICGNIMGYAVIVAPETPTGQTEQILTEGATLADLEVEGENILWYDNDGSMPDFPDGMHEPLPLTTLLVDGTTYYASQTINGAESTQRFGVTVNLVLGVESNVFETLNCYPNPTIGIINLENTNGIDTICIANTLGQKVFGKTINSNSAQVDISSLGKGVYFVTIASGNASKTIKLIKE